MPATPTASEEATLTVERLVRAMPDRVNADHLLLSRGRLLNADIRFGAGSRSYILPVARGRFGVVEPASQLMRPWTFAIRASAATWLRHWELHPAPGYHDILALSKRGDLTIEGNLLPFMQHLQFVKDVLAVPRGRC